MLMLRKNEISLALALSLFLLGGCARVQKVESVVKESEFGIPQDLANQFAVTETQVPIVAPEAPKTPEKKAKAKVAKKTAVKKTKAAKASPVASWPKRLEKQYFWPGEKHVFDVTYFGTTAGSVELTVVPNKFIGDREVFHIRGYAKSTSIFALFYRLNDLIESFVDKESLFTHKFVLKLDETLQQRDLIELYDQVEHKLHFWSHLDHKNKGKSNEQFTSDIKPFTQDVLSSLFYLRSLPLEVGKTFSFPVVSNGKSYEVEAKVIREEKLTTKVGNIQAFVIQPDTKFDGVLKTTGDSFIWISNDEHRSILKIDAKVKIGSVIAYIRELEHGQP